MVCIGEETHFSDLIRPFPSASFLVTCQTMAYVIKEPLIIYRDILIPMMQAAGFQLDFDDSEDTRYHTRFIWRSSYVETDVCSEYYGQTRKFDSKVDVCGVPIGFSFLLLHGIVVGSLADEFDDVKTKIRCSPRTKSLSNSSTDSSSNKLVYAGGSSRMNSQSSVDEPELAEECRERIRLQLQNDFVYKLIELFSLRLDHLPFELKLKVLSYLPISGIAAMSQVSTLWRELTLDEQLWRLMVQKLFPDTFQKREKGLLLSILPTCILISLFSGQSWKALFKDEFRRKRVLEKRRAFAERGFPALPGSPPLLPIMPPPYFPMLPAPPNFIRELFPPDPLRDLFRPNPFPDDEDIMHGPGFPAGRPNPHYFG